MLTKKQTALYWRTWSRVCVCQGWANEPATTKDARRHATHALAGLKDRDGTPRSMTTFSNRDFSRWLKAVAHLQDKVDIRDRDRENASWIIERLEAAFVTLLGHDYAATIKRDWRETEDLDQFPVEDPARFPRDEHGRLDPRDDGRLLDLENLRNTLKNRLGRIIQRIKAGEIRPGPQCPDFHDRSQAHIIDCLIHGNPILPTWAGARMSLPQFPETPAASVQSPRSSFSYCTHPLPPTPELVCVPAEISGVNPF